MAVKPATWDDVADGDDGENNDVTDVGDGENNDVTDGGDESDDVTDGGGESDDVTDGSDGENDDVETSNSCLFSSSFTLHTSITVPAYLGKDFLHNKHQQYTIQV